MRHVDGYRFTQPEAGAPCFDFTQTRRVNVDDLSPLADLDAHHNQFGLWTAAHDDGECELHRPPADDVWVEESYDNDLNERMLAAERTPPSAARPSVSGTEGDGSDG